MSGSDHPELSTPSKPLSALENLRKLASRALHEPESPSATNSAHTASREASELSPSPPSTLQPMVAKTPSQKSQMASITRRVRTPQPHSSLFRRHELMIEYTNLQNSGHCPSGMYVLPAHDSINTWYVVMFLHQGYYKDAVFRFQVAIPHDYPDRSPSVTFMNDVFHPLVDQKGHMCIRQRFPRWIAYRDYIFDLLHYVKFSFLSQGLADIREEFCHNKEAFRMFRNEPHLFTQLAANSAELSNTESVLYDNYPESNPFHFEHLSDQQFDHLHKQYFEEAR